MRHLALLMLACGAAVAAHAAPVTASFSGEVAGLREGAGSVLRNDFPVGTVASLQLHFDNSMPGVTPGGGGVALGASGALTIGSTVYTITGMTAAASSFLVGPNTPAYWLLQIDATGPEIGGAAFWGLQLAFNATLDDFYAPVPSSSMQAGWGVPLGGGALAIHAMDFSGALTVGPANLVPVPPSAALALLGLAAMGVVRRRT